MEKQLDTQEKEATEAISLWEASCSKLSEEKAQLEENLREHESSANEAIAQWEARCATLNQQIENLDSQLDANEKDMRVAELEIKVTSLTSKLKLSQADTEKAQESLKDTKNSFATESREWEAKEVSFISTIDELKELRTGQQKQSDEDKLSLDRIESQNITFQQERNDALKELEEFQGVVLEMKEELRQAKEDLQSFATDQFTIKATEMATQALRQETMEIRSQYKIDHEKLSDEREARCKAEEEVSRLKSELALLVQATEYNDDVAVHVRKIAKKVSAENMKAERKEMEELRTALERLKEELASSQQSRVSRKGSKCPSPNINSRARGQRREGRSSAF